MNKYKLVSYDVWGNKSDGFSVNEAHYTGVEIELPEEYTDLELRRALFNSGYATRGILTACIEINHDYSECIYVTLTGSKYGYKPFCELRKIN